MTQTRLIDIRLLAWVCLAVTVSMLVGCMNPINEITAHKYFQQGGTAEDLGDYVLALEQFRRAWINTQVGNLPPEIEARGLYEMGRMIGYLGQHQEAEALLLESLERTRKVYGEHANHGHISNKLFELGRLHYDRGEYTQAASSLGQAVAMIEAIGFTEKSPIVVAGVMEEYSLALSKADRVAEAHAIDAKAKALRDRNPGKRSSFQPKRYNDYEDAEFQLLRELKRVEAEHGIENFAVGWMCLWLGTMYANQGDHQQAVAYFDRAYPMYDQAGVKDDGYVARLELYAVSLRSTGRQSDAQAVEARIKALWGS